MLCNRVLIIGLELRRSEPRLYMPNYDLNVDFEEKTDTNRTSFDKIRLLNLARPSL